MVSGLPTGILEGALGPPRFLGIPRTHAPATHPGRTLAGVAFRFPESVGSVRVPISELLAAAYVLAIYASQRSLPSAAQDSLPAVPFGPWPGGLVPRGSTSRFQLMASSSTRLAWRTRETRRRGEKTKRNGASDGRENWRFSPSPRLPVLLARGIVAARAHSARHGLGPGGSRRPGPSVIAGARTSARRADPPSHRAAARGRVQVAPGLRRARRGSFASGVCEPSTP